MNKPTINSRPRDLPRPLRIAVIGAGGFVGSRLVAMGQLDAAISMLPVLRTFRGLARLGADGEKAVIVDTGNSADLAAAIEGCDAVVNATSGDTFRIEDDTETIVKACRAAGVKRLIHLGSTIVFGRVEDSKTDDDSPPNTHAWNLYARNKARADVWLRTQMGDGSLQIAVLRPGLIWGPGSSWASMVGQQLWQGNAVLSNNGRGIANLVYVDNLVRMILAVAGKIPGPSGFYNVADLETVTWRDWYRGLAERLGYSTSDIRLSTRRKLHLSPALLIEWIRNRGQIMRWAKRIPKGMAEVAKRIVHIMEQSQPVPPRQQGDNPQTRLRLTRMLMDIQNTAHRLSMDKFLRDFGPLELIPFERAASATAIWMRYAGLAKAEIEQRGYGTATEVLSRHVLEPSGGGAEPINRVQDAGSGLNEESRGICTGPTPGVVQDTQSGKPAVDVINNAARTVVVGCGAIVEGVYRACLGGLERRGYIKVVGVVESDAGRLNQGRLWFPGAQAFENVSTCFARLAGVDLTVITTPPPLHGEHALAAFENGSHVLTEKPMASTVKIGSEMAEKATRHRKVLAVGMPRRFYPALHEARRRLAAGELGDSVRFNYREGGVYSWPVATAAPFRRETSGGGVLLDYGAHAMDTLVFLFGNGEVLACADDRTAHWVEGNVVVELALERGSGTLQMTRDMPLNNGLHVAGSRGEMWVPIDSLDCLFTRRDSSSAWELAPMLVDWPIDLRRNGGRRGVPGGYHECFTFQLIQMLRAIHLSEPPAVSGAEALIPLGLIESAYSKATLLDKPWLSEVEQAVAASRPRNGEAEALLRTEKGRTTQTGG
jgi:predicted dehydrogenase/nucleoside-diphosphate-sugar epimerase